MPFRMANRNEEEERRCEVSSITIMHEGKRYEVKDFMIRSTSNGNIRIQIKNGICTECGGCTFWIFADESKPVMRDGGAL